MYMAYTTNPHLPRVRAEAVALVQSGWSIRKVARKFGFSHCTVRLWVKRGTAYGERGQLVVPTLSSRPHQHPKELSGDIVDRILALRGERDQCAEIIHYRLEGEKIAVSLSSVKRVFQRHGITRFSPWKKWHRYLPRPMPAQPGILVEIDSMQEGIAARHLHAYALIDVCSRWAWAWPTARVTSFASARFVMRAQQAAPFPFVTIQSDHGGEFSKWFTKVIEHQGFSHRHSRVRTPTDNSHVERFIQTLQRDCLRRIPGTLSSWRREIPDFLRYYNTERPHMGLHMKTPAEWLEAID
jgi:transposase InsO family protein